MGKEVYMCNALTGGAAGAADGIDGNLLDGDNRIMVITSGNVYFYYVDPISAAAESSPDIIMPDVNAGDKRLILAIPRRQILYGHKTQWKRKNQTTRLNSE